ncbi:MAG TPA: hypothetical protein PK777_01195, partial [Thermoguttaceae bacterium]|nr:hypothetical protein [Thermoguttaceae bacterium]
MAFPTEYVMCRRLSKQRNGVFWAAVFLWAAAALAAEPSQPPQSKSVANQSKRASAAEASAPSARSKPAPPHVVLVAYEDEYGAARTLRDFARLLQQRYGCRTTLLVGEPEKDLPGLEVLDRADVLVLYVRRKALPAEQLQQIRRYVEAGRPLV